MVFLDANAAAVLGMRAEQALGRKITELLDLAELLGLMKSGIGFSAQIGSVGGRPFICDYLPITEGSTIVGGALTLVKPLAEEPSSSSDELQKLLASAGLFLNVDYDGLVVVDRDGVIVMVNDAFADLHDTTPQAMIGRHVDQVYRNSGPSSLPTVMETGTPLIGITPYLNGKQVYASLFPLMKEGRVLGAVGKILFKDIREITQLALRLKSGIEAKPEARKAAGPPVTFRYDLDTIIGKSRAMLELKQTLQRVARKNSNVLLLGESGTGKELIAHAIHAESSRRLAPFVKVNCAAIPENLLESELFGYADGAFTGARRGGQAGKFELAHTGTIFLDEIGDMPLFMQAKLLRVLQERELTPLGSSKPKVIDVRIVAATNSDLEKLVEERKFREDLYYRLKVVTLVVPPLRERLEDIYPITNSFIAQFNAEFGLAVEGLDQEAWDTLRRYRWPGNIRELRNVIESAFNSVTGPVIRREHIPIQLSRQVQLGMAGEAPSTEGVKGFIRSQLGSKNMEQIVELFEKEVVEIALEMTGENKVQAAQLLGISRQWLHKKLSNYQKN